ncbi:MAG: TIGR04255 family protein [Fimbriimonadaceae bacterium]|nr:TIGR04255 family protein [Fimbriimonadaceae bacterium]QYK55636.1 MAG: TIGR04255 family protein [Fimbriimonadaceae bacterium]
MSSLEFDRLPLAQVDVRLALDLPNPMPIAAVTELQKLFGAKFPKVAQPSQLEAAPGKPPSEIVLDPFQLAGVAFSAEDRSMVVVIQPNLLMVRWIYRREGPAYPRYEALVDNLSWCFDQIGALTEPSPSCSAVQMTYMNYVTKQQLESGGVARYLSDRFRRPLDGAGSSVHHYELAWREERVDLRLKLVPGVVEELDSEPGLIFQTIAGSFVNEASWSGHLAQCHERLNELFPELISQEAKKEWGLHGA